MVSTLNTSCHKEEEGKAVSPCAGKTAADAGFKIYERFLADSVEADTVSASGRYHFCAINLKNTTYKWILKGLGYYEIGSNAFMVLDNSNYSNHLPSAQMYTLTLIVTKNQGACTTLKTTDSLSKQFYIWPCEQGNCYSGNGSTPTSYTLGAPVNYWPIWGTYKGSTQNDPNTVRLVTIFDTLDRVENKPCAGQEAGLVGRCAILRNIPYNNWSAIKCIYSGGIYGSIAGPTGGACWVPLYEPQLPASDCCNGGQMPAINGTAWLDVNNSRHITIQYIYTDTLSGQVINDIFNGWRVN